MNHILIPTDFSVRSLHLVRYALNHFSGKNITVTLFHMIELPGGITDLLMIPRERKYLKLMNKNYREGIDMLTNSYGSRIESIRTQFVFGNRQTIFDQFVTAQRATVIVFPDNFDLTMPESSSIHPLPFIRKAKIPVVGSTINKAFALMDPHHKAALLEPLAVAG